MPPPALRLRPAARDETQQLAALGLAAWRRGLAPLVPPEVAARLTADNPFLPFLQAQGPRVLVAELDGQAVGLGACEAGDDVISDVWVAPAFEGRGAGTALILALEGQIAGRGYSAAKIEAAAANSRALGLYRHLGYRDAWRDSYVDPILQVELEKIGLSKALS